ncbi:MAG: hypothetical protein Q9M75_03460 [Ghiorsea sp.]|nr:hypothetical protein [Ghiorsea sp.]
MSIINEEHTAEAVKIMNVVLDLSAKRDAHDDGSSPLSAADYITYGQQRADAVLSFAQKFGVAYNNAEVTAWYQAQTN